VFGIDSVRDKDFLVRDDFGLTTSSTYFQSAEYNHFSRLGWVSTGSAMPTCTIFRSLPRNTQAGYKAIQPFPMVDALTRIALWHIILVFFSFFLVLG
jgi:hypothetical protein